MVTPQHSRSEGDIFTDLETLTVRPGYIHALAIICFRDNAINIDGELKADDLYHVYSSNPLCRAEISTLVGLLAKEPIDFSMPSNKLLQEMIIQTESLLEELHHSINNPFEEGFSEALKAKRGTDIFSRGDVLREPIFYCGDSAYDFQFLEFSKTKYQSDKSWLLRNKGFSIDSAVQTAKAILAIHNRNLNQIFDVLFNQDFKDWSLLPAYIFTLEEIIESSRLEPEVVRSVIESFKLTNRQPVKNFSNISDFNPTTAFPILQKSETEFILFQCYSLFESLYESPFYWMIQDKSYAKDATKNRGLFTEEFCAKRLRSVFGVSRVHENVLIRSGKKKTIGEIDVLVVYGNRALIVQAKSKGLTIDSRKGNDQQIRKDFQLAIQESYDQGYCCAQALNQKGIHLLDKDDHILNKLPPLKEIYILCVISEHYPALSFQARQFIESKTDEKIKPPFIMDLFTLDAMAEMLSSPIYFLSYVDRRTGYDHRLIADNELTILSYHLRKNLWVEHESDRIVFDNDLSSDLDIALMSRRNGVPGKKTPDGILTLLSGTHVGEVIKQIELSDDPDLIELGLLLLSLNESAIHELDEGIEKITTRLMADPIGHDFTMGIDDNQTGITIHINFDPTETALPDLLDHCTKRKYLHKASTWHGLVLAPQSTFIRFCTFLDFPWNQSPEMDREVVFMEKFPKDSTVRGKGKRRHKR
jgi:hypothetical protein